MFDLVLNTPLYRKQSTDLQYKPMDFIYICLYEYEIGLKCGIVPTMFRVDNKTMNL